MKGEISGNVTEAHLGRYLSSTLNKSFLKRKKKKKKLAKKLRRTCLIRSKITPLTQIKTSTYEFIQFQGTGSYTEKRLLNMYIYIHIYKQFYKSRKANISDQNNSII